MLRFVLEKRELCAENTCILYFRLTTQHFFVSWGKCSLTGGVPDSILQVTRRLHVGDDGWLRYQSVEKISENSNVIRFRRRKACKKLRFRLAA